MMDFDYIGNVSAFNLYHLDRNDTDINVETTIFLTNSLPWNALKPSNDKGYFKLSKMIVTIKIYDLSFSDDQCSI